MQPEKVQVYFKGFKSNPVNTDAVHTDVYIFPTSALIATGLVFVSEKFRV